MPYARTWSEEVIGEWLTWQKFSVVTCLPVGRGEAGGRKEADIVASRSADGQLEIQHIEVGQLPNGLERNVAAVRDKFTEDRKRSVRDYLRHTYGDLPEKEYRCRYITTYIAAAQADRIRQELPGISVEIFADFLQREVLPELEEEYKPHRSRTPPEGLWFLGFLWHLQRYEVVKGASASGRQRPKA